jgi:hypothetical protein
MLEHKESILYNCCLGLKIDDGGGRRAVFANLISACLVCRLWFVRCLRSDTCNDFSLAGYGSSGLPHVIRCLHMFVIPRVVGPLLT